MKHGFFLILALLPQVLGAQTLIDDAGLKALQAREKSAVILDVRTVEEFASGHLPGAKLLPFDAIDGTSAAQVLPTKTTPVVVYCRSGRRSAIAAQALKGLGYTRIWDLGGISNYRGTLAK